MRQIAVSNTLKTVLDRSIERTNHFVIKQFVFFLTLALISQQSYAKPAVGTGRHTAYQRIGVNEPPKLEHSLNVAKSPLEPVTLALTLEGSPADTSRDQSLDQTSDNADQQTTPALREEQDSTNATTAPITESTPLASIPPNSTDLPDSATDSTPLPEGTTEVDSTTTSQEPASSEQTPSTSTTTSESPINVGGDQTNTDGLRESDKSTTTLAPTEEPAQPISTEEPKLASESTTQTPPTESPMTSASTELSSTPTTVAEESSSQRETTQLPKLVGESVTAADDSNQSTTVSTTTSSGPQDAVAESDVVAKPAEIPSINKNVEISINTTTTQAPSSTSQPEESKPQPCSYLPIYDPEELQKVFREETTYKNGTIKGKFTYINFDQRYRLVHYTRLPYGPVKIDQVDELGKPELSGNSSTTSSEVPNAVLQLRNVLPNSLFGFPFIGPQPTLNPGHQPSELDKSYLYSTNSVPSSHLPPSAVPAALSPEQQRRFGAVPLADTLGSAYLENLPIGNLVGRFAGSQTASKAQTSSSRTVNFAYDSPPSQFQHSLSKSYATGSRFDPKQATALMYNFLSHPTPQYQYSPLPLYPVGQPSINQPLRHPFLLAQPEYPTESKHRQYDPTDIFVHETQPHSHEHYVAPFMFNQPPFQAGINQQQPTGEAPKLKLKVKTSRNMQLQHRSDISAGTKSAKLREEPSTITSQVTSNSQHRHRLGKQNQSLKGRSVNGSPIVYHVRSVRVHPSPKLNYMAAYTAVNGH